MSSSQLNNLQVNNLLTNNLVINNNDKINKKKEDIIHIIQSGLYKGTTTYNDYSFKETSVFIIHNINDKDNFIKYYILDSKKIDISNFTINGDDIIIKSTLSLKNGISHSMESKIISTSNISIKIKYSGYKDFTKIFHENCSGEINLINNGFEVLLFDENSNIISKSIYTKIN